MSKALRDQQTISAGDFHKKQAPDTEIVTSNKYVRAKIKTFKD